MTPDPHRDVRAYLDLLFAAEPPGALIEVRTRLREQETMRSSFARVDARDRLATRIPKLAAHADVYVGCAPRQHRSGRRDAIPHAWVCWVDADGPDARQRVARLPAPPTLLVASGSPGAVHAYWRLDRATPAPLVEELNRRLARAAGDPVWAITTILRPPLTHNHKNRPPAAVHAAGGSGAVYDPDQLRELLPPVPGRPPLAARGARPATDADRLLDVAPRDYVQRLLGTQVPRSGFVACPFHADERPSLKVYETPKRGWYCYSAACRRGGSIYDLAASLYGTGTRGEQFTALRARLHDLFPETRP